MNLFCLSWLEKARGLKMRFAAKMRKGPKEKSSFEAPYAFLPRILKPYRHVLTIEFQVLRRY